MRRIKLLILIMFMLLCSFFSNNIVCATDSNINITTGQTIYIVQNEKKTKLNVGDNMQLEVKFVELSNDSLVTWESSDKEVATVDENGLVSAKKVGKTSIIATLKDNSDIKAKYDIEISDVEVTIGARINLVQKENITTTNVGSSIKFDVEFIELPQDLPIMWVISDTSLATIENGLVKTLKPGKLTIAAIVKQGDATYKSTYYLDIIENDTSDVEPRIKIRQENKISKIKIDETVELKIEYIDLATDKKVIWKSSNEDIATVDENGKVTALKEGKITIEASLEDEKVYKDKYEIEVESKFVEKKKSPKVGLVILIGCSTIILVFVAYFASKGSN